MSPPVPYRTTIRHARTERTPHRFHYQHVMWLVDLADMPSPPRRGRRFLPHFAARDHVGDPAASIRSNVDAYLTEHGIDLAGGRILMLTNPRALGYAFNPITVFWCYGRDGRLRTVVAEVHNTFGQRTCYLVDGGRPMHEGIDKALYVSPFFEIDGTYDMRFSEPDEQLDIAIIYRRGIPSVPAFTATLHGTRGPVPRSFTWAALRRPWSSYRVIGLIHWQALQLWRKRIPVVPRRTEKGALT